MKKGCGCGWCRGGVFLRKDGKEGDFLHFALVFLFFFCAVSFDFVANRYFSFFVACVYATCVLLLPFL